MTRADDEAATRRTINRALGSCTEARSRGLSFLAVSRHFFLDRHEALRSRFSMRTWPSLAEPGIDGLRCEHGFRSRSPLSLSIKSFIY